MKICFCARPAYDKLSVGLFLRLKKWKQASLDGIFITSNYTEANFIRGKVKNAVVHDVSDYFKKHWDEFTFEKLCYYEQKYHCEPIWKIIYVDRFLPQYDYQYVTKTAVGFFMFYEEIFSKELINYYYDETIAVLPSYIAYIVCNYYKTKYIAQMNARGWDATHHYFVMDPYQLNCNFDEKYKEKNYPYKIFETANNFLSTFEKENVKPATMASTGVEPKLRLKHIALLAVYIKARIDPLNNNKFDYIHYKSYETKLDPVKFYFRYQQGKLYYSQPDYQKKYVYFPLHYQPEASTLVCATKYEKQIFYIDSWAKSLPADTMLYVKEHYAILGHRDIDFYKQLKHYPNVVLINPWVDSRELIKNAVAVTTLTGTAGWEGMLLRKPVFLGGRIFFENAPGVIGVNDIYSNYLNYLAKWKEPKREDVIKYLCEYISTIYKGNMWVENPNFTCDENINDLAISLMHQIERLEHRN